MPSKLRFMQLDTFYASYLDSMYAQHLNLAHKSYCIQLETIFYDGFAAIHTVAPYMQDIGYESQWVIGNNKPAQIKWAQENNFSAYDENNWLYEIVREQISRFQPDILYTTDSMVFDSRFMQTLPCRPALIMGWQASDIPADTDWSLFDIILSPLSNLRKAALKLGAKNAEHFYPGFPVWINDAVKTVTPVYDITFCGQWTDHHVQRNQFLQCIAENATNISNGYTCGLFLNGQASTFPSQVAQYNHGSRFGIEMYRALRSGRIGFDARAAHLCFSGQVGADAVDIGGKETANMRIFETAGVGTFLLTEYFENLTQFFVPGKEIETFTDKKELIDKIRYFVAHPNLREEIAWNGHVRCLNEHSMNQRTKALHQLIVSHLPTYFDDRIEPGKITITGKQAQHVTADKNLGNIHARALEERFGNWMVNFHGLSIECQDLLSFYNAAKDIFLHRIYDFTSEKRTPIIIDGGGHIGLFTLFAKQKYPDAEITVFEPESQSLSMLRRNLQHNGFSDVDVVEAGLFSHDGTLEFGADPSDGSSLFSENKDGTILVSRLSNFINGEIDFLKLNVEGAELNVIAEIEPKLSMVREMVIEYHGFPEIGQQLHKILEILDRNGFRYVIHDFDAETNPATKPPFHVNKESSFVLLIYAKRLYAKNTISADNEMLRIAPVSNQFGFDRGTPIDRYYIERFLAAKSSLISGTVLEIGESSYTRKFGTNVLRSEVLNAVPSDMATIVGNLATGLNIPSEAFDAIILTQTIQFIYDIKAALKNAYCALKPGGSLLLTASGISQISRYDMDRWGDFWRFTSKSLQMLLKEMAPEAVIEVSSCGNVAVAKAFLDGIALEELPSDVLNYQDDDYQVLLTAWVKKTGRTERTGDLKPLKPLVLIYHRVVNLPLDPQLLCVSPDNFDVHLQELDRNYRVIPLVQMLEECANGTVVPGSVSLTFDDGYLDNLTNALPLLEKYGMHATIFITSGMVGLNEEFWWDAVERIFLTGLRLPQDLSFAGRKWRLHSDKEKLMACDDVCSLLRDQFPETMDQSLQFLYIWSGTTSTARPSHSIVNYLQLQQLAASPYIEIGAHAKHHVRLSGLPAHRQHIEVAASKQQLEAVIGKQIRLFSYPFGTTDDFTVDTVQAVINAGYYAAIANIQAEITLPIDLYTVPRRLVRNWSNSEFTEWMRSTDKGALEAVTTQGRKDAILRRLYSRQQD